MKNNTTELVFILDRSGSMSGLEKDTIGGFNSMIEKQRRQDGECYVSTVLFDNVSEVLHDRVKLSEVKPMTEDDYTAVRRSLTQSAAQFTTSAMFINTHAPRMCPSTPCSLSQPTAWKTPAADIRASRSKQ